MSVYVLVVLFAKLATNVYGPPVVVDRYTRWAVTSVDVEGIQVTVIAPPLSAGTSAALTAVGAAGARLSTGMTDASLLFADSCVPSNARTT